MNKGAPRLSTTQKAMQRRCKFQPKHLELVCRYQSLSFLDDFNVFDRQLQID